MKYTAVNLEEFTNFVKEAASSVKPKHEATIIALKGNLGAGKTTFVQILAKEFGIEETVTSPTFVIQKRYEIKDNLFKKLIHIDAYRLESSKELEALDWEELASNPENIICVEWPENVPELMPKDALVIEINLNDDGTRTISYSLKY